MVTEKIEPQFLTFDLAIVEDAKNALAELADVRSDPNHSCIDGDAMLPALRVMAKHGVIRMTSAPRITCAAGEEANLRTQLSVAGHAPTDLEFDVYGQEIDGQLRIGYRLTVTPPGRLARSNLVAHIMEPGQTMLVKAHLDQSGKTLSDSMPPTYLVMTPKVVSGAGRRRPAHDGFGIAQ